MSPKLSESAIVKEVAKLACERLARKVIVHLQGMKSSLLSGDDSGLQSTWEEICVQVQYEQSIFWDAYDSTARSVVLDLVGQLPAHEREAIWLQTEPGSDWTDKDEDERDPYPVYDGDVADHVLTDWIYDEAGRWTNARIRKYLDR